MSSSLILNFVLLFAGVAGFTLAFYIYHCKHKKQPLVCPIHGSCDVVTGSDYAKFLGIPVELLGMAYYTVVVLFHGAVIADAGMYTSTIAGLALALSGFAFLFSLYLIWIQAFVLKHWCTWCLCSAFLCALIFALTLGAGSLF